MCGIQHFLCSDLRTECFCGVLMCLFSSAVVAVTKHNASLPNRSETQALLYALCLHGTLPYCAYQVHHRHSRYFSHLNAKRVHIQHPKTICSTISGPTVGAFRQPSGLSITRLAPLRHILTLVDRTLLKNRKYEETERIILQ